MFDMFNDRGAVLDAAYWTVVTRSTVEPFRLVTGPTNFHPWLTLCQTIIHCLSRGSNDESPANQSVRKTHKEQPQNMKI